MWPAVGSVNVTVVRACSFCANHRGIGLIGDGGIATISSCSFDQMAPDGSHVSAWRQSQLLIEDCTFSLWGHHTRPQTHLNVSGQESAHIRDSQFIEGTHGIGAAMGASAYIENRPFDGQSGETIGTGLSTILQVADCSFANLHQVTSSTTIYADMSFLP
jgi:hypothetical protein